MVIKTEYGNVRLHNGYWEVCGGGNPNRSKMLHRLIYEDYYGVRLPPNIIVHHIDGDKTNNSIENLKAIGWKEHSSIHGKGRFLSEETRKKISQSRSKPSKYLNVVKTKASYMKQGFTWKYKYYDEQGKLKYITSVDLNKLKEKVLAKGLEWRET